VSVALPHRVKILMGLLEKVTSQNKRRPGKNGGSPYETVRPIIIVSKFGLQVFMRNLVAQVVAAMGLWSRQQPVHCARSL
jgi:hypothetical protein